MTDSPSPLCENHKDTPKLEDSVKIKCRMCSTGDPDSLRDSFYEDAQLCQECHDNTQFCIICQEPI
ncbi:MAG: hypothetical protein HYT61_01375 [Candidatus Yanofskybacteria bacterium]|nr:hypothetical protein [Candidatus Yanofskybacteria bacterium]